MNHPDPDRHFKVSLLKSGLRLFGCVAFMLGSLALGATLFAFAEVFGIVEEMP